MAKRIVDEEMRFQVIINGDTAQKELFDLEKSTRSLTKVNKDLRAERAKLQAQGKRDSVEYKNLTAKIKENSATLEVNKSRMQVLQKQIGVTGLTMSQLGKRASTLRLQLNNMVPGSAQYKRLQADLKAVNTQLFKLRNGAKATQSSLSKMAGGFNKYAAMGASIIAAISGVVLSGQKIIDYNGKLADSMSNVQKTTGLNNDEINDLAKNLGAFTTRTSRIELLKLGEEAGRLGIKGKQNILDFIEQANKIKVALGDDLGDEAIRSVGKMVNVYKVGDATGKDFAGSMDALGSAINEVSASGANQAGFLVNYLERQAGVAAQAKLSAADNLAYAATFDEMGQKVEVSATAMNKLWVDMFKDPAEFADIAGMNIRDFTNLLNTDSNEAMLRFLDGLNGNNDGLAAMSKKLQDVEVDGTRGIAVISALAKNTGLLRERQEQSNKALEESTSLTNEYNLKNNNLAGLIDKITKRFNALMSSSFVKGGLVAILTGFAKLIGAVDDVNDAFKETSKLSFENATNSRKLANESSTLLQRYEALTNDGLEPTIEKKEDLDRITLQLRDRLGESVMSIDAETGAFVLNTAAVREQIKLKRLASDEEAATMASRLVGVQERKKELATEQRDADKILATRQRIFDEQNKADIEDIKNSNFISANEKQRFLEGLDGYAALDRAKSNVKKVNSDIAEQTKRQIDLEEKLLELNFSAADANALINPTTGENVPKEGDTQVIDGQLFTFKNGKWTIASTFTPTGGDGDKAKKSPRLFNLEKEREEVARLMRENAQLRADLIDEDFERELQQLDLQHQERIAALEFQQAEIATEAAALFKKANDARAAGDITTAENFEAQGQILIDKHIALNEQLLTEEFTYQHKQGAILAGGIDDRFNKLKEDFNRQEKQKATAHAAAIAALGEDQEAKARLQEQFDIDSLNRNSTHLNEMVTAAQKILNSGEFKGIDIDLLPPAELQALKDRLLELGLSLEVIDNLLGNIRGEGAASGGLEGLGDGGETDIFGMSINDWLSVIENFDQLENKLRAVTAAVTGLQEIWGAYHDFVNASEARSLALYEESNNEQQDVLQSRLDNGLINERQYNAASEALQNDLDRKKAEVEYKAAKRKHALDLTSAITNTAAVVLNGLATSPFFPVGIAMGSLAGVLGGLQIAAIANNAPVKGFEDGFMRPGFLDVVREQDGKRFNTAFGGTATSGFVDRPTRFIAGEAGTELILSNPELKRMDPAVINSLKSELYRVKGFETGFRGPSMQDGGVGQGANNDNMAMMMSVIQANTIAINEFRAKTPIALLSRDMSNTRRIQEDLDDYKRTIDKSKINK